MNEERRGVSTAESLDGAESSNGNSMTYKKEFTRYVFSDAKATMAAVAGSDAEAANCKYALCHEIEIEI